MKMKELLNMLPVHKKTLVAEDGDLVRVLQTIAEGTQYTSKILISERCDLGDGWYMRDVSVMVSNKQWNDIVTLLKLKDYRLVTKDSSNKLFVEKVEEEYKTIKTDLCQ